MSRIGKKPVPIPSGVEVTIGSGVVTVKKGDKSLEQMISDGITVEVDNEAKAVKVDRKSNIKEHRACHGLMRALIANMIEGVTKGYEKKLEVYGTGYGCDIQGNTFMLNCGFMGRGSKGKYQFEIPIPSGLDVSVEVKAARGDSEPAKFTVRGIDKALVGNWAAEVRRIRPSEPYKGKGLRYEGEQIRRKAGKAFGAGA